MSNHYQNRIAFLGICERAKQFQTENGLCVKQNIQGLTKVILSPVYPMCINSFQLVFALYEPSTFNEAEIQIISKDADVVISIKIGASSIAASKDSVEFAKISFSAPTKKEGWIVFTIPLKFYGVSAVIKEPGGYIVKLLKQSKVIPLGLIQFLPAKVDPLSEDRIAAIKGNPRAAKYVKFRIKCSFCKASIDTYAGIERDSSIERSGNIWYKELPEKFTCKCGKGNLDLKYIRENLHVFLGREHSDDQAILERYYELESVEFIMNQFESLLSKIPEEEKILDFIKANTILLHQFSPKRIFYKSPILSKYKTDITILSQKNELLLIELENAATRLMKKNGGLAAPLQHALDQVHNWLDEVDDHKVAVLDCIGLKPEEVSKISGAVILGRDMQYSQDHLRKLKRRDFNRISFHTYDDLLRSLGTLIPLMRDL